MNVNMVNPTTFDVARDGMVSELRVMMLFKSDHGYISISATPEYAQDMINKLNQQLGYFQKQQREAEPKPEEVSNLRDLEFYREKVGTFSVIVESNIGRTIEFTPLKDHANNTKSMGELRNYLKMLEEDGVCFKFFSDETSKLTVLVPPKFNISGILKAVSIGYKQLVDGNGVV